MGRERAAAPRVILVEDDATVRRSLHLLLRWHGYDVRTYPTATAAARADDPARAGWLIAGYRLPDGDGLAVLHALQRRGWVGRALLVTDDRAPDLTPRALAAGFHAVIEKPLVGHELLSALR